MDAESREAEVATVRAFKAYQERWLLGLGKHARRPKLLDRLSHHYDWDARYARYLRVPRDRERIAFIVEHLRQNGAPSTCLLVGGTSTAGTSMPLADAVGRYVDYGALLICLPGKLALHLPEYDDVIVLERPN